MAINSAFVLSGKYDLKDIDRVCKDFNNVMSDASIHQTEAALDHDGFTLITLHGQSTELSTHYTLKGIFAPPGELAVAIDAAAKERTLLGIINGGTKDGRILTFLKLAKVVF